MFMTHNASAQGRAETKPAKHKATVPRVPCNTLILIEAPVFGGLGSRALPSKNVFADTSILSEKEASNAILYPDSQAQLRC